MTHILYINDNNLRLQHFVDGDGSSVVRSQGYAWFKGDQIIFDIDEASPLVKFCRLAPQEMNTRYWQQCEKSSISNNTAGMRNAADVLWMHLSKLKKQNGITELVLVVPSHYQSTNLELLLGITESLEIKVMAIVNGALLALQNKLGADGRFVHLDVQLHHTVVSYIEVQNGIARLDDVEIIQGVSIQAMNDELLKTLQTHFIQNDRFDPLHNAETEQQLFDDLSAIAVQVNQSAKAIVNVEFQGQLYSTSIDDKVWNHALTPFMDQLLAVCAKAEHAFIQMNGSFENKSLPQLVKSRVTLLNDLLLSNVPKFANAHRSEAGLQYITELKVLKKLTTKRVESKVDIQPAPKENKKSSLTQINATHLLQAGVAVPIKQAKLKMENQQLTLHMSSVGNAQTLLAEGKLVVLNDESCREFRANDRLGSHLVDGVVTVIKVL